jgi:hypothetical protein
MMLPQHSAATLLLFVVAHAVNTHLLGSSASLLLLLLLLSLTLKLGLFLLQKINQRGVERL